MDLSLKQLGIIIAAGGSSRRFGGDKLLELLDGLPVFCHCIRAFVQLPGGPRMVVVVSPAHLAAYRDAVECHLPAASGRLEWAEGGGSRLESVRNGFNCLMGADPARRPGVVAVHDAARPYADAGMVLSCLEAMDGRHLDGCIMVRELTETIHRYDAGSELLAAAGARSSFRVAETPQLFRCAVLARAYAQCGAMDGGSAIPTDEAGLVMRLDGVRIGAVSASRPNPKITYRHDLVSKSV